MIECAPGATEESAASRMSVETAMASVDSLDLSAVMRKVIEEKNWNDEVAAYAELRYRRFLGMRLMNARLFVVPPPDIDAVWHQHILFTREYARDCEKLFGKFLHHEPATGNARDAEVMQQGFVETAKFYAEIFGENYLAAEPEGLASNWVDLFD